MGVDREALLVYGFNLGRIRFSDEVWERLMEMENPIWETHGVSAYEEGDTIVYVSSSAFRVEERSWDPRVLPIEKFPEFDTEEIMKSYPPDLPRPEGPPKWLLVFYVW